MPETLLCLGILLFFVVAAHRRSAQLPLLGRLKFADGVAALVGSFFYAFFLLCSARPHVALGLGLLLTAGLWCVNTAKIKALRGEPLIFSDAALAWQVVRFPKLYVPFLPCKLLLAGALAEGAVLTPLCLVATPVDISDWWMLPLLWPFLLVLLLRSRYGDATAEYLQHRYPLAFDPQTDARRYGPLGAALLHVCWHLTLRGRYGMGVINCTSMPSAPPPWPSDVVAHLGCPTKPAYDARSLPHIFLVQAESFCDPREFSPLVRKDMLPHYDAARMQGICGKLTAGAFGAYTMRTEFAVLTGQSSATLGTDAFHPYWSASRWPTWSLARHLRSLGYRTVCLHPFHRKFFFRHKAIPHLGFEEFITFESFPHRETFGPYVSDASVARSMLELLDGKQPVFCFAITMESHGPWRDGRFAQASQNMDEDAYITNLEPQVRRYVRHLRHADAMIGMLCEGLQGQTRSGLLGWYGDHLPNLPMLVPPGETDTPYFIWSTASSSQMSAPSSVSDTPLQRIAPEGMGGLLLQHMWRNVLKAAQN